MRLVPLLLLAIGLLFLTASETTTAVTDRDDLVRGAGSAEPLFVGWDDGWVAYQYAVADGRWVGWKSPPAAEPRHHAFTAVGPKAAVVLYPRQRYSGWLFDRRAGRWREVPASPLAGPLGVMDPIVVALADRQLLVWGLCQGPPHGAVLDIDTLRWRVMAEAPVELRYRCLHGVIGRKLVVWGGYRGYLQDGAVYDLERDAWEGMPPAPVRFCYGMACGGHWGRFVVFGGKGQRAGAAYDPETRTWEKLAEAPFDVGVMSACAVSGDCLFLWSGYEDAAANGAVYDFRKREWKQMPEAPLRPRSLSFAHKVGNRVVVWGGWGYGKNEAEKLNEGGGKDNFCRKGEPGVRFFKGQPGIRFFHDAADFDLDRWEWTRLPDVPGSVPFGLHPGW